MIRRISTHILGFFAIVSANAYSLDKIPIVYDPGYNLSIGPRADRAMEPLHPFDTKKYKKIHKHLKDTFDLTDDQFYAPKAVTNADLLEVHTQDYLDSLNHSGVVSAAFDLGYYTLSLMPNSILQEALLNPARLAMGGTLLGAELAMKEGWAINLGAGYHHAKPNFGEGGCLFADVPLAIKRLRKNNAQMKVLIVDLDAHQGNGNAIFSKDDPNTFIFDMHNGNEYPVYQHKNNVNPIYDGKTTAEYIRFNYPLNGGYLGSTAFSEYFDLSIPWFASVPFLGTRESPIERRVNDEEYLSLLKSKLPEALELLKNENQFPDLIIYNAGSDIFEEDDLGLLNVSENGIIERDLFVWATARSQKIPILLVLSGGYGPNNAKVVGGSIANLLRYEGFTTKMDKFVDQARSSTNYKTGAMDEK